ncbi:immunoglobulin-like domain-containing protein [Cohnella thailandensis]|uniref:DUF5011 domain-containing protein n=1 Tax=Cohnella thailandensis TaxID=557557 RepID=A0A841SYS6_9BACL|nr:immunoglobulin-like domain-containing protein [Cohnella thailandensis]MBB6636049.1 DUF5011 domain-containing protein [Cohnella thailandensis]
MLFMKRRSIIPLVLSFVLLLAAAVPYGSGKANAAQTGAGSGIVKIAAGAYHSLALKSDGTVVAWGSNSAGQTDVPDELAGPGKAIDIAAAGNYSLALKSDGTVVAWGDNHNGVTDVPAGLTGVVAIAAGGAHVLALKSDGTVVAWGSNTFGQSTVPAGLTGIVAVAAGEIHSLALKSDGTVVAWGNNDEGQTNVPNGLAKPVKGGAVAAGSIHSLALKSDGTVEAWGGSPGEVWGDGDPRIGQLTVPAGLAGVTAIAAGAYHSLALKANGSVVAWGDNRYGQTDVPGLSGVKAVSAGTQHSLALTANGTVVAWGDNYYGQTTVPAGLSGVVAIAAGGFHSLALKADGTVVAWGSNAGGQTNVPAGLSGVVAIAAGGIHSLALKSDGTVVAWGGDFHGQSYVPAGLTGVVAISAGGLHSVALKTDGTVVAWGDDFYGQSDVPAGLSGVVAISAGGTLSLALKSDGTVVAWGDNYYGQLNVPGNNRLSGLTVQEGDLDPDYSSSVTAYTLDGPLVSSVHIKATLADPTYAQLYVDDKPVASGNTATVSVSGASTVIPIRVEPYLKPPRTYTITVHGDGEPPEVQFAANGHATPSHTAESTVTVTDAESGVDTASLQYAWTQDTAVPADGWTDFADGDTLRQTSGDGNWYLHIRAHDLAGNVADAVSNAFVLDNTAPELALNGSNPMNIPQGGAYTEPGATATDAIDGNLSSSVVITGDVDTTRLGNYPVQYAVTDRAGNIASVIRNVYVYDGDEPAIYLNGANPMTVEANSPFVDPGATAQDAQDGDLSASIVVTGTVDTSTLGTYTLTYNVSDAAGNAAATVTRTVYVQDTQPPVLALLGDPAMSVPLGAAFADPGAQATDAYYGDISDRIVVTGTVDTSQAGEYTLRYSVEDPSGNSASVIRDVNVYDGDEPVINLNGPNPMTVEANSPFVDPGATAQDAQDGDLSVSIMVTGTVDTSTLGTYTLTYNVSDAAGNAAATVTRTVYVQDTQPPVLTLLGDPVISVPLGSAFADPGAQATDAYYGDISDRIVVTGTVDTSQAGEYTLRYSVEDPSGNAASVIRDVYVYDGDGPAIYLNGSNPMKVEANSLFVDPGATAQDAQDGDLSASIMVTGTVDTSTLGTYTLTYNVSDAAGNEAQSVTRTVYVQDTQSPVLTLLGDPAMSVPLGATFADPGAQATDAYYGDISDRIVVTGTVDTSQAGEYKLRYSVEDPSGNAAAEATRTVTVTAPDGSNGSDGSSGSDEPAVIHQVSVKINGVVKWVGASYETSGGKRITRIFPTAGQLSEALATEPNGIRIEAQDIGDSIKMDLPAAPLLHALEVRPDALLEWRVNGNGLLIPLRVLQGVPKETVVTFGIAEAAGSVSDAGNGAIARAGGEPLLPYPVVYSLQANDGSSIDWGRTYATLTAALPEPANPDQATAVRIDENGRMRFAPAVFSNDGSPLVTIRSLYNGAYSVTRSDRSFADLNGHWAQKDIVLMANKLLVEGRTQDRFVPDDRISRAEFAVMLVRALGLDDGPNDSTTFRDVAPGAWYAGAVRAAQQHQLINGLGDGTFRPEAPVTREQMAVMIVRAMEYAGHAPDANGAMARTFADAADIAPWADAAVERLTEASIILGLTETKFGPGEYASRAQSAVLLKRMLQAMQFINP